MCCSFASVRKIVLSFAGEVGFLAEERRINVAVTRARRHVAVICDSHTVSNNKFLKDLVMYFNKHGEVRTAFEYLEDVVPEKYSKDGEYSENAVKKETKAKPNKSGHSNLISRAPNMITESQAKKRAKQADGVKNFQQAKNFDEQAESSAKEKLQEEIENFIADGDKSRLTFPSTLTSHDRLLVHQIAEKCGLEHESTGDGSNRCITLSKHKGVSAGAATQMSDDSAPREALQPQTSEATARDIRHKASPGNLDLKRLHIERMQREKDKLEEKAKLKKETAISKVAEKKTADAKRRFGFSLDLCVWCSKNDAWSPNDVHLGRLVAQVLR